MGVRTLGKAIALLAVGLSMVGCGVRPVYRDPGRILRQGEYEHMQYVYREGCVLHTQHQIAFDKYETLPFSMLTLSDSTTTVTMYDYRPLPTPEVSTIDTVVVDDAVRKRKDTYAYRCDAPAALQRFSVEQMLAAQQLYNQLRDTSWAGREATITAEVDSIRNQHFSIRALLR